MKVEDGKRIKFVDWLPQLTDHVAYKFDLKPVPLPDEVDSFVTMFART
jgi:hypothetical protein